MLVLWESNPTHIFFERKTSERENLERPKDTPLISVLAFLLFGDALSRVTTLYFAAVLTTATLAIADSRRAVAAGLVGVAALCLAIRFSASLISGTPTSSCA
jgi:hypothetical protein